MIYKERKFVMDWVLTITPESGDVFEDCNFLQSQPHTKIFEGITGLTFKGCNLVNCDIPADAVRISGIHIHKDFCYHLAHPSWNIPVEIENCPHVVETDVITIDGVVVDTIYHRKDTIV